MIKALRDRVDPDSGVVLTPRAVWLGRAQLATTQALIDGAAHEADAAVYGADELRVVLEKLCEQKCAYCESKIGVNADWDVEHYRPKGRVMENLAHPGYYWLAYEWSNLLPSCALCNQRRRDRASLTEAEGAVAGKADQFPLENEQDRCMDHAGDIARERPYLLNPCEDDPEDHIAFAPDGSAIGLSERGQMTIKICHLDRKRLRDDRLTILNTVKDVILILRHALQTDNHALQDIATRILESMTQNKAVYAGVARTVVRNPQLFL